jgi:NAD(P)-dependent dehydrogenase (short-subunit alcohol dehydrogenase family)
VDLGLLGKAALVTGGRRGIGAAVARALAREGCDVGIVDRVLGDEAGGVVRDVETAGRRAVAHEADVRDFAAAERVTREIRAAFGRLDVVVCAAGITADAMSWKMTEGQWDDVLDVNLKGCFAYCRAAAPGFRAQRGGKIVAIASINGLRGKAGQANYAAAKAGMIALTKTLARELGPSEVNVNAVAPGMVLTELIRGLPPDVLARATAETALGRLARAEDCADAVVFLCSDRARHVTGTVLQVDGGQYT